MKDHVIPSTTSVLLIEDDVEIRSLLHELLAEEHTVVEAENGQVGIQRYIDTPTDIVILEILLPDMDGLEIMKQLQSHDPKVKIIAISGGFQAGEIDVLRMATRLGAKRTLAKPFDADTLLTTVRDILVPNTSTSSGADPSTNFS